MANWHYYNANGDKITVTGKELKKLAKAGVIDRNTIIESEEGKSAPARKVKGLVFPDTLSIEKEKIVPAVTPIETNPVILPVSTEPSVSTTEKMTQTISAVIKTWRERWDTTKPVIMEKSNVWWEKVEGLPLIAAWDTAKPTIVEKGKVLWEQAKKQPLIAAWTVGGFMLVVLLLLGSIVGFGDSNRVTSATHYIKSEFPDIGSAVENGTLGDIEYFVKSKGVDVRRFKTSDGSGFGRAGDRTLLHIAVERYSSKYGTRMDTDLIVNYLIKNGSDVNAKDTNGNTPFHLAIAHHAPEEIVKTLLENGADVNAKADGRETPLHRAVADAAIVEILIANGAEVNAKDWLGNTPLRYAVSSEHFQTANVLLANGADVNTKDNKGRTPLHNAAEGEKEKSIEFLITNGADVNAKDNEGETPLHKAARNVHYMTSTTRGALIANGADVNARNNRGQTASQVREAAHTEWAAREWNNLTPAQRNIIQQAALERYSTQLKADLKVSEPKPVPVRVVP